MVREISPTTPSPTTPSPTTPKACRAAARLGRTVNRALERSDLTPAGYRLLANLSANGTGAAILAEKLAVSRPTLTATVDWLEARGLAERTPDPVDRRRVAVAITAAGHLALARADELVAARLSAVFGFLDAERASMVTVALELLHDALDLDREHRAGASGKSSGSR